MTAQYVYLATDLVTGTILGELPMNGVQMDCQLNNAGNLHAGGVLDDKRLSNTEFLARTTPGKTAFWAYRNNQIVWGGIILSREYQSDGKALTITGQTFEVYASRRFPRSALGLTTAYWTKGMCQTINDLWSQLQSVPNGNIGVQPASLPANDPSTTLTINGYDLSRSYNDMIQSILTLSNGPDYTIAWTQDSSGRPQKQLVVAPRIGNPVGVTDMVVDFPGPIEEYVYNENTSIGANWWWAVGDGDAAGALVGSAVSTTSLGSGWPLWEAVNNYQGVIDQTTINGHATSDLASLPVPVVTHNVALFGDAFPKFGSYGMGDYVTVNVIDPRFPSGITMSVRVVGWSIQPPDDQSSVEVITLVFDEATGGSA